jgi:hypothetical protein
VPIGSKKKKIITKKNDNCINKPSEKKSRMRVNIRERSLVNKDPKTYFKAF